MSEKKRQTDKYGFVIWQDEDHNEKWDGDTTIEQLLLTSVDKNPPQHSREALGPGFRVADDEQLFAYRYGGVLSSRGGWFVVSMYNPYKILRSRGTWLS
jgi:hypothetical protein